MAEKVFIKGNDALALASLKSGLNFFAGYPITPASEIPEYLAEKYQADLIRKIEGKEPEYPDFVFIQAESEIAAISMIMGAAATGVRTMSASSSPGVSLQMESLSYLHGTELPTVFVNIMRGGPGLGNLAPSQADYAQMVKGGGHGDYKNITLAPNSVQEMYSFVPKAFDLAFKYRTVAAILSDGCLGQMKEGIAVHDIQPSNRYSADEWALDENPNRERRVHTSINLEPEYLEKLIRQRLEPKYALIESNEIMAETYMAEDADLICVSYGIASRITKGVVTELRKEGLKVGLIRPQTLWPFPSEIIKNTTDHAKAYLTVELSLGQMVEDVRLAVNGRKEVELFNRLGGMLPSKKELADRIISMAKHYN